MTAPQAEIYANVRNKALEENAAYVSVLEAALRKLIDCRVNDARGIFTAEFINARLDAERALKTPEPA